MVTDIIMSYQGHKGYGKGRGNGRGNGGRRWNHNNHNNWGDRDNQNNWGDRDNRRNNDNRGQGSQSQNRGNGSLPEFAATHSGFFHYNSEKVKLGLDPPLGTALMNGDGDVLVAPKEVIKRIKEVMPYIPLDTTQQQWEQYGTILDNEAMQRGKKLGKSYTELWQEAGYEIKIKETLEDKIEKGFDRVASTMATTMASAVGTAMNAAVSSAVEAAIKAAKGDGAISTPRALAEEFDMAAEDSPDKPRGRGRPTTSKLQQPKITKTAVTRKK